jgi:large subunit ribosomal protein L9
MELILRQDVQNLGFKDDIVSVKNGYGRNFLIPQGFAHLATSSAKKVLAENLKQRAHKEAKVVADAKSLAEALKAIEIKIFAKAGGEKLFGSITNIDIAEALAKGGQNIDRKFITSGIVKRTGKYTASVRLHRDVIVELDYEIVAENKKHFLLIKY